MKKEGYKSFLKSLPIDTRIIIDYAISIYKDLEEQEMFISNKTQKIDKVDKAYLSILLSLLTVNTTAKKYLQDNSVDRETLLEFIEAYNKNILITLEMKIIPEEEKNRIFNEAFFFLKNLTQNEEISRFLTPEKLTYMILKNNENSNVIDEFYKETYTDIETAKEHKSFIGLEKADDNIELYYQEEFNEIEEVETSKETETLPKKENVMFNDFGNNISNQKKLTTAIDRNQELRNIQIALMTPSRKGVILVGEPGVGKRTIVESLAKNINEGNVPQGLKDKEIIEIEIASLLAGTTYRGDFEERVKTILDTARDNENIILFINDIHKGINNSEEENKLDFVSMLNTYLSKGEISVIATTTKEAYNNIILPNNISNKLWKITVEEPSIEVVEEILHNCVDKIGKITGISFPIDETRDYIIKEIVDISSKEKRGYFSSGNNPLLAKGILERTFAIASINNHKKVELTDLIEAIETDETLSKDSREKKAKSISQNQIPARNQNNIIKLQLIK